LSSCLARANTLTNAGDSDDKWDAVIKTIDILPKAETRQLPIAWARVTSYSCRPSSRSTLPSSAAISEVDLRILIYIKDFYDALVL
jgi:hypothetical protein